MCTGQTGCFFVPSFILSVIGIKNEGMQCNTAVYCTITECALFAYYTALHAGFFGGEFLPQAT